MREDERRRERRRERIRSCQSADTWQRLSAPNIVSYLAVETEGPLQCLTRPGYQLKPSSFLFHMPLHTITDGPVLFISPHHITSDCILKTHATLQQDTGGLVFLSPSSLLSSLSNRLPCSLTLLPTRPSLAASRRLCCLRSAVFLPISIFILSFIIWIQLPILPTINRLGQLHSVFLLFALHPLYQLQS